MKNNIRKITAISIGIFYISYIAPIFALSPPSSIGSTIRNFFHSSDINEIRSILRIIKQAQAVEYCSERGLASQDEKPLTSYEPLEKLFFTLVGAVRYYGANFSDPIKADDLLQYLDRLVAWKGKESILIHYYYYGIMIRTIKELSEKDTVTTVQDGKNLINHIINESTGYKNVVFLKKVLLVLNKFENKNSMKRAAGIVEKQYVQDLASLGITVAVSLGGTKIGAAAVNPAGVIFAKVPEIDTPKQFDTILFEAIWSQIDSVIKLVGLSNAVGIGISSPGPLNPLEGRILHTENIPFDNYPLKNNLERAAEKRYGKHIHAEVYHDATAGATGEVSIKGTLSGHRNILFFNWGTGIGNGIFRDGVMYWYDLVVGFNITEIGWMTKRLKNGTYEYVPRKKYLRNDDLQEGESILEPFVAGPALAHKIRALARSADSDTREFPGFADLARMVEQAYGPERDKFDKKVLKGINELARNENKLAVRFLEESAEEVGKALAAFIRYWKFKRKMEFVNDIVIGAGVAKMYDGIEIVLGKDNKVNLLVHAINKGLEKELGKKESAKIHVYKSIIDYDRELLAFVPTLMDVFDVEPGAGLVSYTRDAVSMLSSSL